MACSHTTSLILGVSKSKFSITWNKTKDVLVKNNKSLKLDGFFLVCGTGTCSLQCLRVSMVCSHAPSLMTFCLQLESQIQSQAQKKFCGLEMRDPCKNTEHHHNKSSALFVELRLLTVLHVGMWVSSCCWLLGTWPSFHPKSILIKSKAFSIVPTYILCKTSR